MHEQNMAILKGLCAVAWADGRVAAEEREVIDALLEAFGASRSEAAEIRAYAATEKRLADVPVADLSYDDRRLLLQHAVLLTYIDGEQADSELKMLESLCEVLGIPGAEASGLLNAASERAKKLLNLLD
ncbi:MAG: TerB family tellurite resistance protein [Polyangiaceae bacterium]|nr:TerB family tellurite resistance protein [Polyangiaceae bacterium]MCW5790897.1 TerB family tellurite resistance protein [Polyangiaceae bacterium]